MLIFTGNILKTTCITNTTLPECLLMQTSRVENNIQTCGFPRFSGTGYLTIKFMVGLVGELVSELVGELLSNHVEPLPNHVEPIKIICE